MFVYCNNNPVNRADKDGYFWLEAIVIAVCALALSGCDSTSEPYSGQANCYAYAMGLDNDPRTGKPFAEKIDPGVFSGDPFDKSDFNQDPIMVSLTMEDKIMADAEALGMKCIKLDDIYTFEPSEGCWYIAVAYAPSPSQSDYHFWRRDEDGMWSHKQGTTDISYVDFSGNTITDPLFSDRGHYECFIGYYEIGPK